MYYYVKQRAAVSDKQVLFLGAVQLQQSQLRLDQSLIISRMIKFEAQSQTLSHALLSKRLRLYFNNKYLIN